VYVSSLALPADGGASDPTARDRIFRIDISGRASIVLNFARLKHADGIVWDRFNNRFIIAPASGEAVWTWRPGSDGFSRVTAAPGQYDVFLTLIGEAGDVANIEWDAARGMLYVPLTAQNRVDIFSIPRQQ
jgi:hypothetical protein